MKQQAHAIPWEILAEDWARIDLNEDLVVRCRIALTHFTEEDELEIRTAPQIEAIGRNRRREEDSSKVTGEPEVVKSYSELSIIGGAESIYRLPIGRLLILRYRPQRVDLTNHTTPTGDPVVHVKAHTETSILTPRTPERKA